MGRWMQEQQASHQAAERPVDMEAVDVIRLGRPSLPGRVERFPMG
ncbi:hypothetical protein [Candidatus Nitrospira bockiana]